MTLKKRNPHHNMRIGCLLLCLAGTVLLAFGSVYIYLVKNIALTNVSVRSEDGAITVAWSAPNVLLCRGVRVTVKDGEEIVLDRELPPYSRQVSYTEGEYGKAYTVSVCALYRDDRVAEPFEKSNVLFLEYEKLPELPLMIIHTENGKDPTYEIAEKPDESLWGETQINNEYVKGEMLFREGENTFSAEVKIKTHGNTSVVLGAKSPYKIVLNSGYDLLHQKSDNSCREWILLNNGHNLKTYIGDAVSRLCKMEWNMETGYVNVILNGDYKGCYCLTRAVCREAAGALVNESGYIFENDAYWWKPDTIYFKTKHQVKQVAYTFQYPKMAEMTDRRIALLQGYMNTFEEYLQEGDPAYQDYIDEDLFARWILARDITGIHDGGGANMYLYKYDFSESNPMSSKVKMGPLWDFDTAFLQESEGEWSRCRGMMYFPTLFEQESFCDAYAAAWQEIADTLYANIDQQLALLSGEALNESWKLEGRRWNWEVPSFETQREEMLGWFSRRIAWMNAELNLPDEE